MILAIVGGSAIEFEIWMTVLSADFGDVVSGDDRLERYAKVGTLTFSRLNRRLGLIVVAIGFLLVPTRANVSDSLS